MPVDVAVTYSAVFAPEFVLLACLLVLAGVEWRTQDVPAGRLFGRLGVVLAAWAAAYVINETLPGLLPSASWTGDVAASVAILVGMGAIHAAWRVGEWGALVRHYTVVVLALTAVHLVVTPVWGFSGHVAYTAAPALVLTAVDRRFAPVLTVPLLMVPARPLAGAHTWPEAVGGLLVATGAWYAVTRYRSAAPTFRT